MNIPTLDKAMLSKLGFFMTFWLSESGIGVGEGDAELLIIAEEDGLGAREGAAELLIIADDEEGT